MRWTTLLVALAALGGCGQDPPCGEDEQGNEIPHCEWNIDKVPEAIIQCPGDNWATPECQSCSCDPRGKVLCTEPQDPCNATDLQGG
jgi:hypothetical protein